MAHLFFRAPQGGDTGRCSTTQRSFRTIHEDTLSRRYFSPVTWCTIGDNGSFAVIGDFWMRWDAQSTKYHKSSAMFVRQSLCALTQLLGTDSGMLELRRELEGNGDDLWRFSVTTLWQRGHKSY